MHVSVAFVLALFNIIYYNIIVCLSIAHWMPYNVHVVTVKRTLIFHFTIHYRNILCFVLYRTLMHIYYLYMWITNQAHAKKSILRCDRHSIFDNDQTLFVIPGYGLHTHSLLDVGGKPTTNVEYIFWELITKVKENWNNNKNSEHM